MVVPEATDGVRTGLDPVPTASPNWAVGSKLGNSKVSFRAMLMLYPQNHWLVIPYLSDFLEPVQTLTGHHHGSTPETPSSAHPFCQHCPGQAKFWLLSPGHFRSPVAPKSLSESEQHPEKAHLDPQSFQGDFPLDFILHCSTPGLSLF